MDNSVHKVKKLCAYPLLHRKKKTALWVYALRHTFCISCQPEKKKGHRIGALMIPSSSVIVVVVVVVVVVIMPWFGQSGMQYPGIVVQHAEIGTGLTLGG